MPLSPCTRTQKKSAAPRKVVQCPFLRSIGPRCLKNWTLSVVDGSKKSARGASCHTPLGRPRRLLCDEQIQKMQRNSPSSYDAFSTMMTMIQLYQRWRLRKAWRRAPPQLTGRRADGRARSEEAAHRATPPLQCRATQTLPSTCGCIECIQFMHATHVSCSPPSSLERCRITSVFNEPLERHVAGVALDGPVSKWQHA